MCRQVDPRRCWKTEIEGAGFIIDTVVLYHRRLAKIARQQQMEAMMMQQYGGRR